MAKQYLTLVSCLALTACATQPHRIEPQFVGEAQYISFDCELVRSELSARQARLDDLNAKQQRAANVDSALVAAGTLLVWPAYLGLIATPNHKDEIARLKGESNALENVSARNCS